MCVGGWVGGWGWGFLRNGIVDLTYVSISCDNIITSLTITSQDSSGNHGSGICIRFSCLTLGHA